VIVAKTEDTARAQKFSRGIADRDFSVHDGLPVRTEMGAGFRGAECPL